MSKPSSNQWSSSTLNVTISSLRCLGQENLSFSKCFIHKQKPLRCQYSILIRLRWRLTNTKQLSEKRSRANASWTIILNPFICLRKSIGSRWRYTDSLLSNVIIGLKAVEVCPGLDSRTSVQHRLEAWLSTTVGVYASALAAVCYLLLRMTMVQKQE